MIKIEKETIYGVDEAIRGMRNSMNSWDRSDSNLCIYSEYTPSCGKCPYTEMCNFKEGDMHTKCIVGPNDHELMMKLTKAGSVHGKFRRMITVYVDITAPLYWWKEFDTYKVGTVANSCSTMHKIHAKEFDYDDFSHEHLTEVREDSEKLFDYYELRNCDSYTVLNITITALNHYRKKFLETKDKAYWWQMIQLLPSSYNQKRTVLLNYEVLSNIYQYRREHKQDEWRELCRWIEKLPYSEIITCNAKG